MSDEQDKLDAERYRLLRMFVLSGGYWPFDGRVDAPGGLVVWGWAKLTQEKLDKTLDDMLGLIPNTNIHARPDYQEWRASETKSSIEEAKNLEPHFIEPY